MAIIAIGIDLAKNVFAVHGVDETGKAVKRPGFRGGSNTGEWSHEEVPEVFT